MTRASCIAFTLFLALGTLSGIAQSPDMAVGATPNSLFLPVDHGYVDLSDGNLHIDIPLTSAPQRGGNISGAQHMVYDSRIWKVVGSTWSASNVPGSAGGWRLESDGLPGSISYTTTFTSNRCGRPFAEYSNWNWTDPSGAVHTFPAAITAQYTQVAPTCSVGSVGEPNSFASPAADGSGYTLIVSNYTTATVYGPDGTVHHPFVGSSKPAAGTPLIVDRNGNYTTINANGDFVDSRGVAPLTTSQSGNVYTYKVAGVGGSSPAFVSTLELVRFSTQFGQKNVGEASGMFSAISSLQLPDGSSYSFNYDSGTGAGHYGEMTSMTLPTGGVISFTWNNFTDQFGNNNQWVTSVSKDNGTTTLTPSSTGTCGANTGCYSYQHVAFPSGGIADYDFQYYSAGQYAGTFYSTGATFATGGYPAPVVRSLSTSYAYRTASFYDVVDNDLTLASNYPAPTILTAHTSLDDGLFSQVVSDVGPTPGDIKYYDYGSGATGTAGPLLLEKTISYTPVTVNGTSFTVGQLPHVISQKDGSGNLISQTTYGYDESTVKQTSNLPSHTTAPLSIRGNNTSISRLNTTTSTSLASTYTYYDDGMASTYTPEGESSAFTYGYDITGALRTSSSAVASSSGFTLENQKSVDPNTGILTSDTDTNGQQTTYSNFDPFGRPTLISHPDGGQDYYGFTPISVGHDHNIDSSNVHVSTDDFYDSYGRVATETIGNGQAERYRVDTCYDKSGRVSFVSSPYFNGGGANVCSGNGTATSYDPLGRIASITHADGSTISYMYTGRAVKMVDENGVTRVQQTDALGRPSAVCEVSSDSTMPNSGSPQSCGLDITATGFLTTFAYNMASHESIVYQGNQVARAFITDSLGRPTIVQEPEMFTGDANTLTKYSYAYNSTGLQITRTRPRANQTNPDITTTTVTQYDSLGRINSVTYNDGTHNKLYLYDTSYWAEASQQNNLKGRLSLTTSHTTGFSQPPTTGTLYSYDAMGRVLKMWECQPSGCGNVVKDRELDFGYDYAGRLLSQADPTTGVVHFTYSPENEITGITNSTYGDAYNPTTYISSVVNGPLGPTSYHLGNGLNEVILYETAGQVQNKWLCAGSTANYCSGGTQLYGLASQWRGPYLYNGIDTVMNTGGSYTYDDFGRLKSFTSSEGQASSFTWTYDRWGNRWSQTPGDSVTYNGMNHKMDGSTTYDAAANIIQDAAHRYTYDAENNLISVDGGQTASYVYDALNQRVRINVPNAARPALEYTYDFAGRRITTWDANANFGIQGQAWWGNMPFAYRDVDGHTYFQQSDRTGTQRMLTDYTGNKVSTYLSNPFGDGYSAAGSDNNRFHYAGTEHDAESGTDHAQYRQYDTNVGVWMSMDPYRGSYDWSNPQSLNRYTYSGNNPLGAMDTSGLMYYITPNPGGGGGFSIGYAPNPAELGFGATWDEFDIFQSPQFQTITIPNPYGDGVTRVTVPVDNPLQNMLQDYFLAQSPVPQGAPIGGVVSAAPKKAKKSQTSEQAAEPSCLDLASATMARDLIIGEGVGMASGALTGGLVAAGATVATDTYPFAGATIPAGTVGGAMIGGVEALPTVTFATLVDGAYTFFTCH